MWGIIKPVEIRGILRIGMLTKRKNNKENTTEYIAQGEILKGKVVIYHRSKSKNS